MIFWNSCGNFNSSIFLCCNCCTFINLLQKFIENLAAILGHKVLQVSLCIVSIFDCSWNVVNFAAISMQINCSHVIRCKPASSSACYLRSGDKVEVVEKLRCENNMNKVKSIINFDCKCGSCSVILHDLPPEAYWTLFYFKI